MWRWGWSPHTLLILQISVIALAYNITVPSNYELLSGDIDVRYSLPHDSSFYPGGFVRLIQVGGNRSLARVELPLGISKAQLSFSCGAISRAGDYLFEMYDDSNTMLTESNVMTVQWPRIDLTLPSTHNAQTESVILTLTAYSAPCSPHDTTQTNWLELVYYKPETNYTKSRVVYREVISQFWTLTSDQWILPCHVFEVAGLYVVFYKTNSRNDNSSIISKSNPMHVTWSKEYLIKVDANSIFPCDNVISVQYNYPACIGSQDMIRLYSRSSENVSSLAKPIREEYVTERRVKLGQSHVLFKCWLFSKRHFSYCFSYVSVSSRGAVNEQTRDCIYTEPVYDPVINGGWSSWSEWGSCTTTCGEGISNRYRICDNPKPQNGGEFCRGPPVESRVCQDAECYVATTSDPLLGFIMEDSCHCGCVLNRSSGIVTGSHRLCNGNIVWVIKAPMGHRINISFEMFDLNQHSERLRIRDGILKSSNLLAMHSGTQVPPSLLSSTNHLTLEFRTPPRDLLGLLKTGSGFVCKYKAIDDSAFHLTEKPKAWYDNIISLLGIGLCGATIFIVILLVIVHIHKSRRLRRKHLNLFRDGTTNTSPHSKYDGFTPLSQGSSDDDEEKRKEHTYIFNSFSQDGSSPGIGSSPSWSESIPSPYHANATPYDYLHNIKLLRPRGGKHRYDKMKRRSRSLSPLQGTCNLSPKRGYHSDEDRKHGKHKHHHSNRKNHHKRRNHDNRLKRYDVDSYIEHNLDNPAQSDKGKGAIPKSVDKPSRPTSFIGDSKKSGRLSSNVSSKEAHRGSAQTVSEKTKVGRTPSLASNDTRQSKSSKFSTPTKAEKPPDSSPEKRNFDSGMTPTAEECVQPTPTHSATATTPSEIGGMEWDFEYDYCMPYVAGSIFNADSNEDFGVFSQMETSFNWELPESEAQKVITPKKTTPTTPSHKWNDNIKEPLSKLEDHDLLIVDTNYNYGGNNDRTAAKDEDAKNANPSPKKKQTTSISPDSNIVTDNRPNKSKTLDEQNDLSRPSIGGSPKLSAVNLRLQKK